MMAQSASLIVFVTALFINTFSNCYSENVYCVTPTATSCSSCPHNSANCTTLPEYAKEAEMYFTSNTTMVFLPGDHALDTNITVANIAGLTLRGEYSDNVPTVVCHEPVGLSFVNVVDFKMYCLAIASCSRYYNTRQASNYVLFLQSTLFAELVNCSFHDNLGTALVVNYTNITLAGNNEFTYNHCTCNDPSCEIGCGITALNSVLLFTGNTSFLNNKGGSLVNAGAISAAGSSLHLTGTNKFIQNSADSGLGGAVYANNTSLSFVGSSDFNSNAGGMYGGAIYVTNTSLSFTGVSNFKHNLAGDGGAIFAMESSLHFIGVSNFKYNKALAANGGAISASNNCVLNISGTSNFSSNYATQGGAISAQFKTTVMFDGTISFTNNTGTLNKYQIGDSYGGGLYLAISSFLILPNTTVYWENNHATFGGAIYVVDSIPFSYCALLTTYVPKQECFFQLSGQNLSKDIDIQLVFKRNTADAAGSVLYGGVVDHCKLTGLESYNSGEAFDMIFHIEDDNTTSSISSNPIRICPCNNPKCYGPVLTYTVYPGETIQVSVIGYGQRNGTVPTAVRSRIVNGNLPSSQSIQQTSNTCTTLNYTVFPLSGYTLVGLYADGPCSTFDDELDELFLQFFEHQSCPPGFSLSDLPRSCVCEQSLQKYTNNCHILNGLGKITHKQDENFWVGYSQSDELILSQHCPFDYCVSYEVNFSLNETDKQCANNRSGLLCGACKANYSMVLGTSNCKQCSNSHLALLIPFALMGVALVFLLLVCKLTVATGTLSGLLFYANIVGVNRTIFLPVKSTDALSLFLAWLNLDFGIETCFFDGMDAYSKIWLQFVFPAYIWLLVGIVIFISNFSPRFADLLGNNPVSVLATLILLSYTKILRTLFTVIGVTYLEYPTNNSVVNVLLYDANIEYFRDKHIPLFLVAVLVFLFLFLPYTLLLLFGQWLQTLSHLRLFSWQNSTRLKAFMDSYHAPYKRQHRYWPGLLLALRFVLFIVFAIEFRPLQDTNINLLTTLLGAGMLQLWAWISGGVYRNWCLDALEGMFALNLIILVGATYFIKLSSGKTLAVGYTSVSIALITFIGILTYHIFQQVKHTKLCKRIPKLNFGFANKMRLKKPSVNKLANSPMKAEDYSRLREPLLEDLPQQNYGAF